MTIDLQLKFALEDVQLLAKTCVSLAACNKREGECYIGWLAGESAGRAAAYTLVATWLDEIITRVDKKEVTK